MLIHITPKLHLPHFNGALVPELLELRIDALNLVLKRGRDLIVRQSIQDKNIYVGCRLDAPKAIEGVLIDTPGHVNTFTTVARWSLSVGDVVTHQTTYRVLDDQYDAVTDRMAFWKSRWPDCHLRALPGAQQPRMDIWPGTMSARARTGDVTDTMGPDGFICERRETFAMPTMESHLLMASMNVAEQQEFDLAGK